jgi:hypothetical protein
MMTKNTFEIACCLGGDLAIRSGKVIYLFFCFIFLGHQITLALLVRCFLWNFRSFNNSSALTVVAAVVVVHTKEVAIVTVVLAASTTLATPTPTAATTTTTPSYIVVAIATTFNPLRLQNRCHDRCPRSYRCCQPVTIAAATSTTKNTNTTAT